MYNMMTFCNGEGSPVAQGGIGHTALNIHENKGQPCINIKALYRAINKNVEY